MRRLNKLLIAITGLTLAACGSLRPFHDYARPGDSIAIPVGKQTDFKRDNITVTITPSAGLPVELTASDLELRAIINFYPDPVSSILVSKEISENLTPHAQAYYDTTHYSADNDSDWFQTVVFIDVPMGIPSGLAQIEISNTLGTTHTSTFEIIDGIGTANNFSADVNNTNVNLDRNMLDSLSRVDHTIIEINSNAIPAALEITFTHDPDVTIGGTGKYSVINPKATKKNLLWNDDGTNLKVIMLEAHAGSVESIKDYKFYIAGSATNLQLNSINGYDATGAAIPGVTATLSQH